MKINIPQKYFSKLMRAVVEFQMIENGDKILIGLSGGKDSIFLTYTMAILKERLHKRFEIEALTINPLFPGAEFHTGRIRDFCESLSVPYHTVDVDIAGAIDAQGGKTPCFTCAYFRRGAMNRFANEHGCNKIAYAHHNDDAVETFFMSLLYSGQLTTFTPVTYLDRSRLTVIRPLIYFREEETREAIRLHGFQPEPSPCPHDGHTIRQTVKDLIKTLEPQIPDLYDHLAAGMRKSSLGELWPAALNRKQMRQTYYQYLGHTEKEG